MVDNIFRLSTKLLRMLINFNACYLKCVLSVIPLLQFCLIFSSALMFESGLAGTWHPWELCPYGSPINKFSVYYESGKGSTGVRLTCKDTPEIKATSYYDSEILTQDSPACADGFDGASIKTDPVSLHKYTLITVNLEPLLKLELPL